MENGIKSTIARWGEISPTFSPRIGQIQDVASYRGNPFQFAISLIRAGVVREVLLKAKVSETALFDLGSLHGARTITACRATNDYTHGNGARIEGPFPREREGRLGIFYGHTP